MWRQQCKAVEKWVTMTKHILQGMLEALGYNVRSYSGRGMYGNQCLGVTLEDRNVGTLVIDVMINLVNAKEDPRRSRYEEAMVIEKLLTLGPAFRQMKTDDMGLGIIVYFPNVNFTSDADLHQ